MLLQLINDPNTHGAALMATLDAVKGWADDAVAGCRAGRRRRRSRESPRGVAAAAKREPGDARRPP